MKDEEGRSVLGGTNGYTCRWEQEKVQRQRFRVSHVGGRLAQQLNGVIFARDCSLCGFVHRVSSLVFWSLMARGLGERAQLRGTELAIHDAHGVGLVPRPLGIKLKRASNGRARGYTSPRTAMSIWRYGELLTDDNRGAEAQAQRVFRASAVQDPLTCVLVNHRVFRSLSSVSFTASGCAATGEG